jgi:hypothetical protein
MNTHRKASIELSIKDKNYNPDQNVNFTEVKVVRYSELEQTFKTCNYSPIKWKGNYRAAVNFISATGFVVDIDNGTTLDEAELFLNQQNIKYALITSKSHSDTLHKFHILLPFGRKVYTRENYKAIANRIKDELFPTLDINTLDAARYIFGSPDTSIYRSSFTGKFLCIDEEKFVSDAWDDLFEVTLADSSVELAVNVKMKRDQTVPIYCPFHNDGSPSAFLAYSEENYNHFIHCSSCGKTYWKVQTKDIIALKSERFWSLGTGVYEAGIVGDVFSLENIAEKKFFVKIGAETKKDKDEYYKYIVNNKHLHRMNRIDNIGDVTIDLSMFDINPDSGNITVRVKALPVNIKDNVYIEEYLTSVFGPYKTFIKEWLACYVHTNYRKLPTLILGGPRGVGKNTFAEAVQAIFPVLSDTAKDLEGNFNPFAEKKLLVIDESASNGKLQYQQLKKFSGQKYLEVNKKYLPQYQVQNNLNIIYLSNDDQPVYVERDEIPTDVRNNQFFVYRLSSNKTFDSDLNQKLIDRLGHYIRTELKVVFNKLNPTGFRYTIAVPITDDEKKLFNNSVSGIEEEVDRVIDYVETNITNSVWSYYEFAKAGYLPTGFFQEVIQSNRVSKTKVIQKLQKHKQIANDKADKYIQVNGKRPYCYKLGPVWLSLLQTLPKQPTPNVPVPMFPDRQIDGQPEVATGTDQ